MLSATACCIAGVAPKAMVTASLAPYPLPAIETLVPTVPSVGVTKYNSDLTKKVLFATAD